MKQGYGNHQPLVERLVEVFKQENLVIADHGAFLEVKVRAPLVVFWMSSSLEASWDNFVKIRVYKDSWESAIFLTGEDIRLAGHTVYSPEFLSEVVHVYDQILSVINGYFY